MPPTLPWHPTIPKPWQMLTCCPFHHFIFSEMFHEWNHTVYNLLRLFFHSACCPRNPSQLHILIIYSSYANGMNVPQVILPFSNCWTFLLLPVWGYYKQSFCEKLCTGFCVDLSFHFSEISAKKYDYWVKWQMNV